MSNIQVHTVMDDSTLMEVLEYIKQYENGICVVDVETDNSLPQIANTFGIGFSFDGNEAFYVPYRFNDRSLNSSLTKVSELLSILSQRYKVIGHNFVYDYIVLKKEFGIDFLPSLYSDTILMKHTVDEERPHGLKETSVKYLGPWADKAQEKLYASIKANGGLTTKDNLEMWKADTEVLAEYCGWDCALTVQLFNKFQPMLEEQKLLHLFYEDEVMPLYKEVTIPMNERGFPVDVKHFEKLQHDIRKEILILEDNIQNEIAPYVEGFCQELLDKDYPVKRTGNFPKVLAENMGVQLPIGKTGKVSLSAGALAKTLDPAHPYTQWLLEDKVDEVLKTKFLDTQVALFFKDFPERNYIFNLKSNDHLGHLLFNILGLESKDKTEAGKPKVDEDVLDGLKEEYSWINNLVSLKKLSKLEATYISSILEKNVEGIIYPSFLQFGTTSGRYSCVSPNLQNLPRVKDDEDSTINPLVIAYSNKIKEGFIAGEGFKLVDADQSALEPRAFACAAGDPSLQEAYRKGLDLYSEIAIRTFGLSEYSADKRDDNYLGKHKKEARQKAKVIALAVVYGAGYGRLSSILGISAKEAQAIIEAYLEAYPKLKEYMKSCDEAAIKNGFVVSRFGRVRHIPKAKAMYKQYGPIILDSLACRKKGINDLHWELKGLLNLAKNHPIQSTAAYVINKASIEISRRFKERKLNAYISAQIHDQITCIAPEKDAEEVRNIMQDCMENTVKLEVPFIAEPMIGNRWNETK